MSVASRNATADPLADLGGTPEVRAALKKMIREEQGVEPAGPLATRSAQDIFAEELEPVDFVVPGIIAVGGTLFIAKPKTGKTYLAIDFGYAVATGGKALGAISCEKGDALLLLLEDNVGRFQRRLKQRAGDAKSVPDRLQVAFQEGTRRIDTGLLDQIRDWHKTVTNPRLVVIDTLTAVRPLGIDKRGVFQAEYELCRGVNDLAHELKVAIIIVHHMRKMTSDDILDDVSGTLALNAAVDTTIGLRKMSGGYELRGRGRDVDEFEFGLTRGDGRWTMVGSADELRMTGERRQALSILRDHGVPMTASEIAKEMGRKADGVRKMLDRMDADSDGVEKFERGKYRLLPDYEPEAF
ncbi:MAG TPA: AAA family ATPase [Bauldia sp.]|nr:AAA family ATPase [Bauldia sp.]